MRILWLSHFVPWPATGHGALQRSHHLLRQAARHHDVHLLALSRPEVMDAGSAADAERELTDLTASARVLSLPRMDRRVVAAMALFEGTSYWERALWHPPVAAALDGLLRAHRFDVVHLDAIFLARYRRGLGSVPIALNHHNVESHLLDRRAESLGNPVLRHYFRREARGVLAVERRLAPLAAVNLVVSALDGERLRALAPGARVAEVPNGVDVEYFRPSEGVPVRPRSFVFAGGMNWFPNRDAMQYLASELWPALTADAPDRTMTIVGRDAPPELLAVAAADSRLRVTGFVDDVRPHVERAAVYLCPIRVGGGTRLKILDALAMERPLVSTAVGVEGLGLRDGEHYLRAESAAEVVAAARRLEDDPMLARRLARAGRGFVEEHFSWEPVGARLNAAYERAVTAPPPVLVA